MTIFTPPKRKISLASMALGTLLMTSLSAGNANALFKCAECNRITCKNSKILNHCVEKCDYSSIENCVSQKCSQLNPDNKKRLVSALQSQLSAKEKEHTALEEQMKAAKITLPSGAALSGGGKTAASMAGSSNKEQVKLMKKQADLVKEINILKGAMEHCGLPSTSNAPSTPGTDTPPVSPESKPNSPAASHENAASSPDQAPQHEEAKHEDANKPADVSSPPSDSPSPTSSTHPHKPPVANSETNILQAQLNRALEKREQKRNSNNESSPSEGETPPAKGAAEGQKPKETDHPSKTYTPGHTKNLPHAQAAREQLNPVVKTVTPSTEETTSPAEEKGSAETSGTQSGTHLQGPPPPPPLNLAPPPKSPPPPMGNVTHSQGTKELDMRRFDASSGPYMDDHRNTQEAQSQHKGPGTSTPHPTSGHIQTPPPSAEEATPPQGGRGIPTPPPMGNATHSQGTAAPKVAAPQAPSGRDDLLAAIRNNPKQRLKKVETDTASPASESEPEGIHAVLEKALAARRERVKPEPEEPKLTPEEQAAKDKEWE